MKENKNLFALMRGVVLMLVVAVMCMLSLQGCGAKASQPSAPSTSSEEVAATTAAATEEADTETSVADASTFDLEYSKRDLDASYDESAATKITLAETSASVSGAGATADGSMVTITAEGVYVVSGSLSDGQLVVEAPDDAKVQVVLKGVTIHNEDGPALCVNAADKVFITLAAGSTNTLTDGAAYTLAEDEDEPNAALFSKADLTLNGSGSLVITSAYRHAVCSKDDLVITDGSYVIAAVEDALRGRDCVKICGGTFDITAGADGVKSNNDEDDTRGFVCIDGGTFNLAVGDDAVHAETSLFVNDGTVNVTSCYEGYEAEKIYVNGANTHIEADDDALNAAASAVMAADDVTMVAGGAPGAARSPQQGMAEGGMGMGDENCLIQINGGYLVIDSGGDSIDSNGSVEITGGTTLVCGPTDSANGSFDYDLTATISGGTVLMVGSAGMAQNFTSGTQPFAMTNVSGSAGQNVAIVDGSGNVVVSFTATKQFGMVLTSSPVFTEGSSYQVVVGGTVAGTNADGYAERGSVSGGVAASITASTTASSGMGGLGADGQGMAPGMGGPAQRGAQMF